MSGTAALASTNGNTSKASTSSVTNTTEETTNNKKSTEEKGESKVSTSDEVERSEIHEIQQPNDGALYLGEKPDSTNMNSLSKFNFIFYFIYKLKYDEDPNGIGHLNYEF